MAALGVAGFSLSQFRGPALWSIGIGIVAIIVPFVSTFYLPIAPILGLVYGIRAVMRGLVIGGVVGIVVNVVAGGIVLLMWIGSTQGG